MVTIIEEYVGVYQQTLFRMKSKRKIIKMGVNLNPLNTLGRQIKIKLYILEMSWQDVIDDFDETYKKKDTPQLNQTTWEGFECLIKIYQSEPTQVPSKQ